jgi:hypothetical protein
MDVFELLNPILMFGGRPDAGRISTAKARSCCNIALKLIFSINTVSLKLHGKIREIYRS